MGFSCLQLPTSLASGWVKAAACRLAHFPTQPFPRCSINSTPCFHQTGPLICPGGLQTASAQVGSPAGMPSLLSTFELCQLSQATSRNFLGISLSPPPTPSPAVRSKFRVSHCAQILSGRPSGSSISNTHLNSVLSSLLSDPTSKPFSQIQMFSPKSCE